jgi:hypothetical protein
VPTSDDRPPIAVAMEWVARIAAVALEMVVPGLAGKWLDDRWKTEPLLTLIGFGLGMAGGIWHLLLMTASAKNKLKPPKQDKSPKD